MPADDDDRLAEMMETLENLVAALQSELRDEQPDLETLREICEAIATVPRRYLIRRVK
jgi:hypothetical protein